jgi:hypothetical protein
MYGCTLYIHTFIYTSGSVSSTSLPPLLSLREPQAVGMPHVRNIS